METIKYRSYLIEILKDSDSYYYSITDDLGEPVCSNEGYFGNNHYESGLMCDAMHDIDNDIANRSIYMKNII